MDPTRFDAFTKTVSTARSRRTLLRTLGAALGATGLAARGGRALATKGGNSACAHFCAAVFGADTPQAEQCTREAAHGGGLCYCTGGEAGAPCSTGTECCSGQCGGGLGCCPTCPAGCHCAILFVGGLTCTTGSGSGHQCDQFTPCTMSGEACVGGHCQTLKAPATAFDGHDVGRGLRRRPLSGHLHAPLGGRGARPHGSFLTAVGAIIMSLCG